ncbi:UNVERIFIED_ORG: putative NAD(P)/FAD-binding protein YdhS [Pseudomonas fluorescens]|jgi:uncharacterized NAD(P)/FAD-binding protein YdhS|uniref:FAD/NAD(P)-binding protein n=1 Tax=Pseudomonas TaxID=286 RepID=UPI000A1FE0C1|nr:MULTISPECIES: FAD/NAD(P)-binding protein [unclassified Pseudomonas]MDP9712899.1 putative NAD(P)/FAD-binding protein YdhS [Pseudomonas fluorescens]
MKTLVIIGAGFSGAVTAAQFLRRSLSDVRVVLINRSGTMARGLAYGTNSPLHLLNVPAGNMSADVDDPEHFLRFCQARDPACTASSFIPRKIYGEYLTSVLDDAEKHCSKSVRLERLVSEVHSIKAQGAQGVVELAGGEKVIADRVVLAFGNFSPVDLDCFTSHVESDLYESDPWAISKAATPDVDLPILLVGAGLTALDVALGLIHEGHRGPIHMLSRRGLCPAPHRASRNAELLSTDIVAKLMSTASTVRSYMRVIRTEVDLCEQRGVDWRDVLGALRPITPTLWKRLPNIERQRFLRHLQPYWDVHRHRVAPEAYSRFERAQSRGQIRSIAGRIKAVTTCAEGMNIDIQARGEQSVTSLKVAKVVNCTGPNTNLRRVEDRLIRQLERDGLLKVDALNLGLCVSSELAVLSQQGKASDWLFYIGPMLKADYWEATAVPELRQYGKVLALKLIVDFELGS